MNKNKETKSNKTKLSQTRPNQTRPDQIIAAEISSLSRDMCTSAQN